MQTKHQKRRIRVAAQISSVVFASRICFVHEMRRRTIRELDVEHFLHIFHPNLIYSPFTRMSRFSGLRLSERRLLSNFSSGSSLLDRFRRSEFIRYNLSFVCSRRKEVVSRYFYSVFRLNVDLSFRIGNASLKSISSSAEASSQDRCCLPGVGSFLDRR